jgi:diguanylate cyclase (GGDEF)-like protein
MGITVAVLFSIFYKVYLDQRSSSASFFIEEIRKNLSEMSYVVSKEMSTVDQINLIKSKLDRNAAKNDFIAAYIISDQRKVILTTDEKYQHIPPDSRVCLNIKKARSDSLFLNEAYRYEIRYFESNRFKKLNLYLFVNPTVIDKYFQTNLYTTLIYFLIATLMLLVFHWIISRIYIAKPLEKLRQYAYYNSEIPNKFTIRELEYIRSSMVQTFHRLEDERKELYRLSRTDMLSGLPNRNSLNERLQWLIADASRDGGRFALLFMDIDHFKEVNDALGHKIGDELLVQISKELQNVVRANDIIARVGGDEFVIVLHDFKSHFELTQIIERILAFLSKPWNLSGNPIHISGSIGVAFYPKDGQDIVTLMKNADIAMYEAKRRGRNQFYVITEALNEQIQFEIQLEKDMRAGLARDEFKLFYQPIVDLHTKKICGVEALIRWQHPEQGWMSPDQFIPLSENNGFIIELGEWIYTEAMHQQKAWEDAGICCIKMSINISPKQLHDKHFIEKFTTQFKRSNIRANNLGIEITETLFMENHQQNFHTIKHLNNMGIAFSLDDFGTGYSSLAYLKQFPVRVLKIDKSFLDDYQSESGSIFIETIIKMAQTLNLKVIAEGAESEDQVRYLIDRGCDMYQGYFCAKPMPADAVAAFIQKENDCISLGS